MELNAFLNTDPICPTTEQISKYCRPKYPNSIWKPSVCLYPSNHV